METQIINGMANGGEPYIEVIEQPQSRGFRFRYQCEGPSHGGLQGENSRKDRKTHPTVKIYNYKGPARIIVTLVTDERTPRLHAHELMGKNCVNGICMKEIKGDKEVVCSFQNMGVRHVTKKRVVDILKERTLEAHKVFTAVCAPEYNPSAIPISEAVDLEAGRRAEEDAKSMQLNVVRLCFQAFILDPTTGAYVPLQARAVSAPIYDSKSPGASPLKICRMDKNAGCCLGGEEVFLLCDRVQKDDIAIRFFEHDVDGQIKWEGYGDFGPNDVHRQYAIVFKTPQYQDIMILRPAQVYVQLKRMSDGETSDPKPFTYYPQQLDHEEIAKKKKKQIPHFGGANFMPDLSSVLSTFPGPPPRQTDNTSTTLKDVDGSVGRPYNPTTYARLPSLEDSLLANTSFNDILANPHQYIDMSDIPSSLPPEVETDAVSQDVYMDFDPLINLVPRQAGVCRPASAVTAPTLYTKQPPENVDIVPHIVPSKEKEEPEPVTIKPEPAPEHSDSVVEYYERLYGLVERLVVGLHSYAMSGDLDHLLLPQRHLIFMQDDSLDNCVHVAVIHNRLEALNKLLSTLDSIPDHMGLSQYNDIMQTPLHLAVLTRQPGAITALLKHGADCTIVDRRGDTVLHMAVQYGYTDCLHAVTQHMSKHNPLQLTQCINARNFQGYSALHCAVIKDHLRCVRHLCEVEGVEVDLPDGCSGRTPLHHAIQANFLAIVGYLILEAGADVNQPMYDGNTALHLAALHNLHGVAALLMTADADPDAENLEVAMVTDEWSDEEVELEEEEFVGTTPRDYACFNDKMLRILNGEAYTGATSEPDRRASVADEDTHITSVENIKSFYESGFSSLKGNLDHLDAVTRVRLAQHLDPLSPGQDWVELSRRLGLAALSNGFRMESSPTKTLLKNYETLDGTIEELCACLESMGHVGALSVLDEAMPH